MDYPFYIRYLADVPSSLFDKLVAFAKSDAPWKLHPYFRKGSVVLETLDRSQHRELDETVAQLAQEFDEWLPASMYTGYSMNRLPSGGLIREHSDINTFGSTEPMKYVLAHKIHIPLISDHNVVSQHRRSKQLPFSEFVMEPGKAYLYNDYVWHAGYNAGTLNRVHMLIKYYDPEWTARLGVLKKLGIDPYSTYE